MKSNPAASSLPSRRLEFPAILAVWVVLALIVLWLGRAHTTVPGLYYDEAVFGGMAKDFVTGHAHGQHMPNNGVAVLFGHPFPVFVQPYLGALKSWLLIPAFSFFGSSLAVLRLTNLAWCLAALLLFMVWVWKWIGPWEAAVAGALLALDPSFFFLAWLDWGSVMPSLLCRFAGFLLVLQAWRTRRASLALLAGAVFGLGFFNKIDFAVILIGTALAAGVAFGRPLVNRIRARPVWPAWIGLGFLIGAGPMCLVFPRILGITLTSPALPSPGEWMEKIHTLRAMYDGSYFYRLMDAGGLFNKMYQSPSPVWTPLGLVLLIAVFLVAAGALRARPGDEGRRVRVFLLLAFGLVTLGGFLLPGAVRIHHAVLVFPFPHLLIAVAGLDLARRAWPRQPAVQRAMRRLLGAGLATLLVWQLLAIGKTEELIRATGGRGWWSTGLVDFCREMKGRTDLTLVSLDWGFNEQLSFLTDGPKLQEPIWRSSTMPAPDANCVFLVHAPEYRLFNVNPPFLQPAMLVERHANLQPWRDGEGRIVFFTVQFPAP